MAFVLLIGTGGELLTEAYMQGQTSVALAMEELTDI